MKTKRPLTKAQAGEAALRMLMNLQTNAREIRNRSENNPGVQKLCAQMVEFSTNLMEWGTHEGNIEIWASFVPSMLDYSSSDEGYAESE